MPQGLWLARTAAAHCSLLATRPVAGLLAAPPLLARCQRLGRRSGEHSGQLPGGRLLWRKPAGCWLLCWLLLHFLLHMLLIVLLLLLGAGATKPLRLGVRRGNQALQLSAQRLAAWRRRKGGAVLRGCGGCG